MSVTDKALQSDIRKRHEELCNLFESELRRFCGQGQTLREIKELKLYKETHKTFEGFLQARFGIDKTYAHRLIGAAEVEEHLLPIVNKSELPQTESQYREVAKAPVEKQAEVVRKAAEKAAEENRKPTAQDYKQAVKQVTGELLDSDGKPVGVSTRKDKPKISREEQIKANRKLAKDYIAKAVNAVDDYNAVKPNNLRRADVVKLLQKAGENLW
jgi:ribosomal protein RSM22 (predicted rRNA methylase)